MRPVTIRSISVDALPQLLLTRFGLGDPGHIGKRDDHAIHRPLCRAVGQDAHQVLRPALAAADAAGAALASREHRSDLLPQIEIDESADNIGQRPAAIDSIRLKMPLIAGVKLRISRLRSRMTVAISVTSNRLRRLSLTCVEFLDFALQFDVDRLQLLVDRL